MVIFDCSTTVSCDVCSCEFTVIGKMGKVYMRRLARLDGWRVVDGKDVCPRCAVKMDAAKYDRKA